MNNIENEVYKKVAQTILPDLEKIKSSAVFTAKKEMNKSKKTWLIPVFACVGAAILICTAVPEVRAKIAQIIWGTEAYLSIPKEERQVIPEVEEFIQEDIPTSDSVVKLGEEIANWSEISAAREEYGFAPFNPSEFEWLRDMQMQLDEVFFDGTNIIITGNVTTNKPEAFFPYIDETRISEQAVGFLNAQLEYDNNGVTETISGVCNINMDSSGYSKISQEGEEYVKSMTHIPVRAEFYLGEKLTESEKSMPAGEVAAKVTMSINDGTVDDLSTIGIIGELTFDTAFDASKKFTPTVSTDAAQTVTLSGESTVTLSYGDACYGNEKLSLDDFEITVTSVEQGIDSYTVYFTQKLPDSWDREICNAYFDYRSPGLVFFVEADGASSYSHPQIIRAQERTGEYSTSINIMPNSAKSIKLIPVIYYFTSAEDEEIPYGTKKVFEDTGMQGISMNGGHTEIPNAVITLL